MTDLPDLNLDFLNDAFTTPWGNGSDPTEDYSLVRPSDTNLYDFNTPSNMADPQQILASKAATGEDKLTQQARDANNNAIAYLQAAQQKSASVSPEQAFATALLAAIPSIGGYITGKSIGKPNLPAGFFEAGGKTSDIPGYNVAEVPEDVGGLRGTEAGGKAASGYLAGLDAEQEQKNKVSLAAAEIEKQKAARIEGQIATQDNQRVAREDNQSFQRSMVPVRTAAQEQLIGTRADNRAPTMYDRLTPEQQANKLATTAGMDADGNKITRAPTPREVNMMRSQALTLVGPKTPYFILSSSADAANAIMAKPAEERTPADSKLMLESFARSLSPTAGTLTDVAMKQALEAAVPLEAVKGELQNVFSYGGNMTDTTYQQLANAIIQRKQLITDQTKQTLMPIINQAQGYQIDIGDLIPPEFTGAPAKAPGDMAGQIADLKTKIAAEKARLGVK